MSEVVKLWHTDICEFEVDGQLTGIVRRFSDGAWGVKLVSVVTPWTFAASRQTAMDVVEQAWEIAQGEIEGQGGGR